MFGQECQFNGESHVAEVGHVTEVVSLMEREWSYGDSLIEGA